MTVHHPAPGYSWTVKVTHRAIHADGTSGPWTETDVHPADESLAALAAATGPLHRTLKKGDTMEIGELHLIVCAECGARDRVTHAVPALCGLHA